MLILRSRSITRRCASPRWRWFSSSGCTSRGCSVGSGRIPHRDHRAGEPGLCRSVPGARADRTGGALDMGRDRLSGRGHDRREPAAAARRPRAAAAPGGRRAVARGRARARGAARNRRSEKRRQRRSLDLRTRGPRRSSSCMRLAEIRDSTVAAPACRAHREDPSAGAPGRVGGARSRISRSSLPRAARAAGARRRSVRKLRGLGYPGRPVSTRSAIPNLPEDDCALAAHAGARRDRTGRARIAGRGATGRR